MGGGGNTSSTEVKLPPWAEPTGQEILARGQGLSDAPYQQYQGQQIAGLNPTQYGALDATAARAAAGNALENQSQSYLQGVVGGAQNPYGGQTNPYFEDTLNRSLGDVQSRVNTQFANPNAWGSSGHVDQLGSQLGGLASQMRSQQYTNAQNQWNTDQARMMSAAGMAPQYGQIDYGNLKALLGVGDAYRSYEQDLLNQGYQDWGQAANYPYKQLDVLSSALQGATRGQSSTSAYGPGRSPLSGALGGGLAGYALGNAMDSGYGTYGAGIGALLGALG